MSYPETAQEALAAWDNGDIVWTVELGGMGPGYEQAIHVTVFEIIRDMDPALATKDTTERFQESADATVRRISAVKDAHLGLSGAQVGAATKFAFHVLRDGWRVTLERFKAKDADRLTMVSRAWPHLDVPKTEGVSA